LNFVQLEYNDAIVIYYMYRNRLDTMDEYDGHMRKLLVPRTHNKLGDSSFSAAGPRLWNDLPPGLRRSGLSFDSFRRSLKTSLLQLNWLFRLIGAL